MGERATSFMGTLLIAVLAIGLPAIGCSDSSSGAKGDLSGVADASAQYSDMAGIKFGCAGFVTCYLDCFANTSSASGCQTMCGKQSKNGANVKFNAALMCAQTHCAGDFDAGTAQCVLLNGTYANEDGTPISGSDPGTGMKRCNACLLNTTARFFGKACATMSSPDCNPTECTAATDACLNDLP